MKYNRTTAIAVIALGAMMTFTFITPAAEDAKLAATTVAEKKTEAVKPAAKDIAKLEKEVGLTEEQKAKVNALLNELKEKRRAIKEDSSMSSEEKKTKMKALNEEIQGRDGKIKALMTVEQFAKWEKLREARRVSRK